MSCTRLVSRPRLLQSAPLLSYLHLRHVLRRTYPLRAWPSITLEITSSLTMITPFTSLLIFYMLIHLCPFYKLLLKSKIYVSLCNNSRCCKVLKSPLSSCQHVRLLSHCQKNLSRIYSTDLMPKLRSAPDLSTPFLMKRSSFVGSIPSEQVREYTAGESELYSDSEKEKYPQHTLFPLKDM